MKRLFGTDGIRGEANRYPMTAEVALALGRALTYFFKKNQNPRILIGKDTRLSGYMLETAMVSGISSMGGDVLLVGPMPTPAVGFLAQAMRADAGVMLSASHNPFQDNGIKIFDRQGFKLPDEVENRLEELIFSEEIDDHRPSAEEIGKAFRIDDARGRYIEFLKSSFPKKMSLEGMKIVVDCAHGSTYLIAPTIFEELGAEVVVIGAEPDGRNINDGYGAVAPQNLAQKVSEVGADLGIALDGDGDRAVFVDETGGVVPGDAILAILAEEMISLGNLKDKTLVATIMTNMGVDEYLARSGGKVIRTQVGDRYVVEAMKKHGLKFGGEPSGHLVFLDYATTGDGLIAGLQMIALMLRRKQKLSQLSANYRAYPQVMTNIRVRERKDFTNFPEIQRMIREIETSLGQRGRLVVRYSGTEPLVRVMIEGQEGMKIDNMAEELAVTLQRTLA